MKKVNIYLILLLSLSVFSCTKIDEESLTPVNASVDVYQTMIVGKWKLVAVGTVSATVSDPDSPNAPAEIIDWTDRKSVV